MADTRLMKQEVESYVRNYLSGKFGVPFAPRKVKLVTGGLHEFDAVSEDGRIVAAIKSAGGKTVGGKNPSGKIKAAIAELYFLTLVEAPKRFLILTSPAFLDILSRELEGRLAKGVDLKLVELPLTLQQKVSKVQAIASYEVSPTSTRSGNV
jgi:hypothetical protein